MATFRYRFRDDTVRDLSAEELIAYLAGPIDAMDNPTDADLLDAMRPVFIVANKHSQDNREEYVVRPDEDELRAAREKYDAELDYLREVNRRPDGSMPPSWSEPSKEVVEGTVRNIALQMAEEVRQEVWRRVDGAYDAAKRRHEHFAENDLEAHREEYAAALAELEAEEAKEREAHEKDVRARLREKVARLPDEHRREYAARFPGLLEG